MRGYITFVKAAAILGIYFYHYYEFWFGWGSIARDFRKGILQSLFGNIDGASDLAWRICRLFFSFGNNGVGLFLIASGFGLYLSYLKREKSWKDFFKRRALRVLPLYWAALVWLYVFVFYGVSFKVFVYHLFLVQTYTREYLNFGALWFVGYIFQLYLLFPFFVRIFQDRHMKWIVLAASFFITPLALAAIKYFWNEPAGIFPTSGLSLFLFGMILAESFHHGETLHRKVLNPFSAVLSLLILGLVVYLSGFRILPVSILSTLNNVLRILIFTGLFLFYQAARRVEVALKAMNIIAYGAYVVFLIHLGVIVSLFRIILPAISGGESIGKMILYITGGYLPVGPWTFLIPAVEFLLVILLFSYWVQKSYDYLLRLIAKERKDLSSMMRQESSW